MEAAVHSQIPSQACQQVVRNPAAPTAASPASPSQAQSLPTAIGNASATAPAAPLASLQYCAVPDDARDLSEGWLIGNHGMSGEDAYGVHFPALAAVSRELSVGRALDQDAGPLPIAGSEQRRLREFNTVLACAQTLAESGLPATLALSMLGIRNAAVNAGEADTHYTTLVEMVERARVNGPGVWALRDGESLETVRSRLSVGPSSERLLAQRAVNIAVERVRQGEDFERVVVGHGLDADQAAAVAWASGHAA